MHIIEASRDLTALERYLPLFIEKAATEVSALAARRRVLRRSAAVNPERVDRIVPDAPRIPHAFELWIGHLGWLERLSHGVRFTLDDLTTEEARGLALLRQERERFWQAHSSCPVCNSVNPRSATFCGGCGQEWK
jgi:hypothetical protein